MNSRYFHFVSTIVLVAFGSFVTSSSVEAENARFVSTSAQDEPRKMPEDNTAYFSRTERKIRFQLVKLSGKDNQTLAGTKVTVIDPTGQPKKIVADAQGVATLDVAKPGLHAMVVAGKNGHTAMPIAFREDDHLAAADEQTLPAPTVKLSLMDIDPQEVVRLTSSYLPPEMSGSYDDIDNGIVSTGETVRGLQYRVRLGADGSVTGQVYSLVRDGLASSGVEGTNILIYRANQLVARTTANVTGKFIVPALPAGVYGVVGVGPAGYAAFAFEAYDASAVVSIVDGQTLVSTREEKLQLTAAVKNAQQGSVLPVVLVPPAMVGPVLQEIRNAAAAPTESAPLGPEFGGAPAGGAPGGGFGGGAGPGGGFGGGGAAGGLGGAGGLLGLAAAGGIAAVAAGSNNNNNNNPVIVATNGGL